MPFNKLIEIPFEMPKSWGNAERWIKGDMINAVGFHRVDLLRLGKTSTGKRIYQMEALPDELFKIYPDSSRKRKGLAKSVRKDSCRAHDSRGIFEHGGTG